MKKYLLAYGYLALLGGSVIALDQWTKYLVRTNLAFGQQWAPWPWLLPYARILHVQNSGAAFGMLQELGMVFAVLAVIVSLAILYYFPQVAEKDWTLRLALGLQFGGAMGNLVDRLTQHWIVTDFISVGSFAVFNVADASISVGVAVLLLAVWLKDREAARNVSPTAEAVEAPAETTAPTGAEESQGG